MKICIIIPVYNEEKIIEGNLKMIIGYAQKLPVPARVLAVNDGSTDRSGEIISAMAKQEPEEIFQAISYRQNRGYGGALKAGTMYAIEQQFDYVIFMDSDLTNHPEYLLSFYEKIVAGCDYIKATRYSKGGRVEGVPWKRRLFSRIGNLIGVFLFRLPLTDVTNGFRAINVKVLEQLKLREDGFPIIMEELCQAKRLVHSFCEVPYILTNRKKGQEGTHFSYVSDNMVKYLKYALIAFLLVRARGK